MIAIINGIEYTLHNALKYTFVDTLELYIVNDSADDIVSTIGESATVTIPDEYTHTDLVLDYIRRFWDRGESVCEVVFKPIPIKNIIDGHTEDIEVISGAIEELAEIIDSGNEDIEAISQAIEELAEIVANIETGA